MNEMKTKGWTDDARHVAVFRRTGAVLLLASILAACSSAAPSPTALNNPSSPPGQVSTTPSTTPSTKPEAGTCLKSHSYPSTHSIPPGGAGVRVTTTPVVPPKSGGAATSLVLANGSVWVTAFGVGPGHGQGDVVERIDPATSKITATICMQGIPGREWGGGGMAAAGGYVWVAGYQGKGKTQQGLVQGIDPKTNTVAKTVVLGRGVSDLAANSRGLWALVILSHKTDEVARLSPSTGKVLSKTTFKASWIGDILLAGKKVWVSERGPRGSFVARVIPTSSTSTTVITGSAAAEPIVVGGMTWAATGDSLTKIDPTSATIVTNVHVGIVGYDLAADSRATGSMWFLGRIGGDRAAVEQFDANTGKVGLSVPLRKTPTVLAIGANAVWILNYGGSITKVSQAPK